MASGFLARMPAAARGMKASGIKKGRKWKIRSKISRDWNEVKTFWMFQIGRWVETVFQEPTWKEHGENMTGLVFKLEGKHHCALAGWLTSDDLSGYWSGVVPGDNTATEDLVCEGFIASSRSGRTSLAWTGKEIGSKPWPYFVKGNGQNVCAITDKPVWIIKWRNMGRCARKNARGGKRQGSVDAAKKEG